MTTTEELTKQAPFGGPPDAIVVGQNGEVNVNELEDYDPSRDFIVRQGELTYSGPESELDTVLGELRKLDPAWDKRPVECVRADPVYVLFTNTVTWTDSRADIEALEAARNTARAATANPDVRIDYHYVLGLTPGHGLIGTGRPTRASADDYFRQRGETDRRLSLAAANPKRGRAIKLSGPPGRRAGIALIDTGGLPTLELLRKARAQAEADPVPDDLGTLDGDALKRLRSEVQEFIDRSVDIDRDDWATFDVNGDASQVVIGPHMGHAAFVSSILRLAAPSYVAKIYIERAVDGDRARCNLPSSCATGHADELRGVVSEESVANQIFDVVTEAAEEGAAEDRDRRIDVVNLSLGGYTETDDPPVVLAAAIEAYVGSGGTVVAAAGNWSRDRRFYPAALDETIAVGALECGQELDLPTHNIAEISNYGDWVDFYAPGSNIVGTYVEGKQQGRDGKSEAAFDGWARWSGTSFAAPYVTGVIAATLRHHRVNGQDAKTWLQDEHPDFAIRAGIVPSGQDGKPVPKPQPATDGS